MTTALRRLLLLALLSPLALAAQTKTPAPAPVAVPAKPVADTTVLWFARPSNGVYLRPELIRMDGKSGVRVYQLPGAK